MGVPTNLEKIGRWYHFRKQVDGETTRVALKTTDKKTAITRARALSEQELTKRWESVMGLAVHRPYATIGEVIVKFKELALGAIDAVTVRNSVSALRLVVRRGLGQDEWTPEQVDRESTLVLTGGLVEGFERWYLKAAAGEQEREEAAKRTVGSYLRQARSLFKSKRLKGYERAGLVLPKLTEFLEEETEVAARAEKMPPNDALLAKTFAAAKGLREADPVGYICWLLAVCSLRRGEISFLEAGWLVEQGGQAGILVPRSIAKSRVDRFVPVDGWISKELNAWAVQVAVDHLEKLRAKPGAVDDGHRYLLPAVRRPRAAAPRVQGLTESRPTGLRAPEVFKRVNAWMRGLGWETNHTLHEMRAYFLREADKQHGIGVAQALAGHADRRTTEQHYIGQRHIGTVQVKLPQLGKAMGGEKG